jgi:hypothetical protein
MNTLDIQEKIMYGDSVAARKKKGSWGGKREGAGRWPRVPDGVSFTGQIPKADMEALKAIAEERDVPVASIVREAISAFLKRRRR